jgi:transcriptional regulator with XRE-family HTH domain
MKTKSKNLNDIFGDIHQSNWNKKAEELAANIGWIQNSQKVAIEILEILEKKNWSQKDLAASMHVSPQIVNKWLRGKENFTFETVDKLEKALDIRLLHIHGPSAATTQVMQKELSFVERYERVDISKSLDSQQEKRETKVIAMHSKYSQFSQVI